MDNAETTFALPNPKRPRIDYITTGDEEGLRPFEIRQSWRAGATDSSRVNLDQAAQRHSDDTQCKKYNKVEKYEVDDVSSLRVSNSRTATSHMDRNVTPSFSSGDVSSHPAVGVEEGEAQRHGKRADGPTSHSQRDEEPSVSPPSNTSELSDAGAVASPRRDMSRARPGGSPERQWPPPDKGGRQEGGRGGGEAHAIAPSGGQVGKVKGRRVYGDAQWDVRGGDSRYLLGGEGDEKGRLNLTEYAPPKGAAGEEEACSWAVPSDDVIMMSSRSTEGVNLSGNVLEVCQNVENNGKNLENYIKHRADALMGIKDAGNSSPHSDPRAGCIGSPVITHDALLVRNVPNTVSTKIDLGLVIDDHRGGGGRHGTSKMIADMAHKMADHTCETMMPAQITQGLFEGDNDAGPFSVIDPAICSQAGRQDEEKNGTSQSASTGAGCSPSERVTALHGTLCTPTNSNDSRSARNTKEIPSSDHAWRPDNLRCGLQLEGQKHNACRPATTPAKEMGFSIIANKPLNETQNEMHGETGNAMVPLCLSYPANSQSESFEDIPPAGEKEGLSLIPAGAFWEHQDPNDWSSTHPGHLNAQVETAMATKITERLFVKTACFEGEQLTSVRNSPEKIRRYELTAGTNQHQKVASSVPALELATDLINATKGKSCYQFVVPSLHTEDKLGTDCVLSPTFGYRPAINMMDMIEHHRFPQSPDAIVPGPRCITRTITYTRDTHIQFTQECFQPSPPPSSAAVLSDRTPAAADTFEKIQLSLSDDDCVDEGPGHSNLLSSSPELVEPSGGQLVGTQPGREPAKAEEVPGTDAVKNTQAQWEDTGEGCFDSINRPCEIPSRISTMPPVSTLPVSQSSPATCRVSPAVYNDQLSAATDNDNDDVPLATETFQEFGMKQQFDKVMQELRQFSEIGASDPSDSSSSDWGSVLNGPEETGAPGPREGWSTPLKDSLRETSSECLPLRTEDNDEDSKRDCSLKDQQVPPPQWSQPCLDGEDSMYSLGKHREENEEGEHKTIHLSALSVSESRRKREEDPLWTPSFQFPLSEVRFCQRQTDPKRRLEPLRTCARPIRLGLSKRAKTSHLHRNHYQQANKTCSRDPFP